MGKETAQADSASASARYARAELFALADREYKDFHAALIPSVSPERIIGVRVPVLRALAKRLRAESSSAGASFSVEEFLEDLPHFYYEENNLHAFFIEKIPVYEECLERLRKFLPFIDNWATCDMLNPAVFKKHTAELLDEIMAWTSDSKIYTVRFGVGMLMRFYLDYNFDAGFHEIVSGIKSGEYYVNMMRAWYFATALAKQYEKTVPFFERRRLDKWTHNKGIQKAVESFRVSAERKAYLKTLKLK